MSGSTYLQQRSQRPLWGLAAVVLVHLAVLWALSLGWAPQVMQKMPTVVQAMLLQETPPPALPPPPPRPAQALPPPAPKPPPPPPAPVPPSRPPLTPETPPTPAAPAWVPPSEVPATASPAPSQAITAVSTPAAPSAVVNAPAAPARPAAPVRTAATVSAAQCDKPDYPSASRRMEEEGTVSLRFLVGVDGKVLQSEIEKSSGFKRLDEAARAGLSKCRFKPATVNGQPEPAWASMTYTWRLE